MIAGAVRIGATFVSVRGVLECNIESAHTGGTAKADDFFEQGGILFCEVFESHLRPAFFASASLIDARTYSVPASKQYSLRRRSSRMPITPRGYNVMTRLGFTPWVTLAKVFRLTSLECSVDVMRAYFIKVGFARL